MQVTFDQDTIIFFRKCFRKFRSQNAGPAFCSGFMELIGLPMHLQQQLQAGANKNEINADS